MPIPTHPLTPLSSTDIASQDRHHAHGDSPLELPPPAIQSPRATKHGRQYVATESVTDPDTLRKRKRSSAKTIAPSEPPSPAFALPPPPTRSRTIIQMQPGMAKGEKSQSSGKTAEKSKAESVKKAAGASGSGGKRAARKTAHSVIEKRRRSKMNEEFETMKEMIPACKGQTMHKLAILQAGIEYLRYLEQCVHELKTANSRSTPLIRPGHHDVDMDEDRSDAISEDTSEGRSEIGEEDENRDEDDDDSENDQANISGSRPDTPQTDASQRPRPMISAAMSWSASATTSSPVSPNMCATTASPAMNARDHLHPSRPQTAEGPGPERADFEATAALLMLNGDRGFKPGGKAGRGLSVQDLLSN